MGAGFSSQSEGPVHPAGNVISLSGELLRYSLPVTAAEVLKSQSAIFICDSDSLLLNEYIPPLLPDDYLRNDSIYFVLPVSKLRYRLSASDMSALAVKASVAIDQINSKASNKSRVSPPVFAAASEDQLLDSKPIQVDSGVKFRYSQNPATKLCGKSSRRTKVAVRGFKINLSTIYEGSVLVIANNSEKSSW